MERLAVRQYARPQQTGDAVKNHIRLLLTAATLSALASPAFAADEIHWTIIGPNAVTFDWRGADTSIRYGLTSGYGLTATAHAPTPLPFSSAGPFWEAPISSLVADTLYHYSIGTGADHTFRTPRAPGRSDFMVMAEADIGSTRTYPRVGIVQQEIAALKPAFTLMVGDLTYANDHGQADVDQHFNDVTAWSQDAAYMPAWGNHEYDSSGDDFRNYKGRFDLPNAQSSPGAPAAGGKGEDWSWFDYGNVRFIAYPEPYSGAFLDWYTKANTLMDAAQADPNITFIVTYGHRPAYSSGHHPGLKDLQGYIGRLGAAHSKYKLNINGHSHNYERSYPQSGVIHITTGGGGASLEEDPSSGCLYLGGCPAPSWSAFRAFHHGSLRLSVSATALRVDAICGPPGDSGTNTNDITCSPGSVFDTVTIPGTAPTGNQAPNATIGAPASDVTIVAGSSVTFQGTANDPDGNTPLTYLWNFGGGAANTTVQNPGAVAFATAGTYHVTFTATDSRGLSDPTPPSRTVTVTGLSVNQAPNSSISSPATDVSIATGQSVTFQGSALDPDGNTPLSYQWNFGGGAANSTAQNPGPVTFATAGTFNVSFTATDALGLSDPTPATRVVTVSALVANQPPNGRIDSPVSDTTIVAGDAVVFLGTGTDPDGNTPVTYSWNFGGGPYSRSVQDPGPTKFPTPGIYIATFTVRDSKGLADPTPPTRTIVVTPNQAPNGTIDAPVSNVTVQQGESVSFLSTGTDPDGDAVSYRWTFDDSGAPDATVQNPVTRFDNTGTFAVWLTVTDSRGLADPSPDGVEVTVVPNNTPPNGDITSPATDDTLLVGESIDFAGTGTDPDGDLPLSYSWDFGGASPVSSAQNPGPLAFQFPGNYTVTFTVTDSRGASDPTPGVRHIMVIGPKGGPNDLVAHLDASPVTGIAPLPVLFNPERSVDPDGKIYWYAFDFGDGTVLGPFRTPFVTHVYGPGTWVAIVTVTDLNGSTASDSVTVRVAPVVTNNLALNSSFELAIDGWTDYDYGKIARVHGGFDGDWALAAFGPGIHEIGVNDSPNWVMNIPVANLGKVYRYSAWVRSPSGAHVQFRVREYRGNRLYGATQNEASSVDSVWRLVSIDHPVIRTGDKLDFQMIDDPTAPAETLIVDNIGIQVLNANGTADSTALDSSATGPVTDADRARLATAADAMSGSIERGVVLAPNPIASGATIGFSMPVAGPADVRIIDLTGRVVRVLLNANVGAGRRSLWFDGRGSDGARLPSGVYFYRVRTPAETTTRKFAMLR